MPTVSNMGAEIALPRLELRPWGLFTQIVEEVDVVREDVDRTGFGAKWIVRGPYTPNAVAVDCETEEAIDTREINLDTVEQMPFSSYDMLQCSSIGGLDMPEINAMLLADEEFTRSAALTLAITTQITPDHLNLLDDSTLLGAGTDIADAMGLIENGLGDRIANARGHIFVPLRLLAAAFDHSAVFLRDGELSSPAGHRVISDSGHGLDNHLFATGALAYSMTDPMLVTGDGHLDRETNTLLSIWERKAFVAFNPLHSVRATVT